MDVLNPKKKYEMIPPLFNIYIAELFKLSLFLSRGKKHPVFMELQ